MANRTQLRLTQLTASFGTAAGEINDQISSSATGSAINVDFGGVMSMVAGAIKRINGADSFSQSAAGLFTHATSTFSGDIRLNGNDIQASDGVATLTMSGRDLTVAGDLTVTGNDIKGSGGTVITLDGSNNAAFAGDVSVNGGDIVVTAANDTGATLNLQADNNDDNGDAWTLGAQTSQAFGVLNNISGTPATMLSIVPHATPTNSVTNVAGKLKVSGLEIQNADGEACISIDADQNATVAADLTVAGNDIDFSAANAAIGASVGANVLSLGAATSTVAALNHLRVDGNILADANEAKEIFAAVTSANITLGGGGKVIIPGDLNVEGTTTTIDSVNLLVKDPVIAMGAGNTTADSNGGMAIISGSSAGTDLVFGRVAADTMAVGILDTQSGSVASVAGMAVTNFRAGRLEVDTATNYIDRNAENHMIVVSAADLILDPGGSDVLVDGHLIPSTSNGGALGSATMQWQDLFLAEGGVINWDGGDMTMTQASNVLTVAGGDLNMDGAQKVTFGGSSNSIQLDTDLKIVAAADIRMDAGGNDVQLVSVGTNPFLQFNRASANTSYLNFSTNDGAAIGNGSAGFGIRNNNGTMQFKNSTGAWTTFGAGATADKKTLEVSGSGIASGDRAHIGALDLSSIPVADREDRVDAYVNGQLLLSGSSKDYILDQTDGAAATDIRVQFALVNDDVLTVIVR